jgi:uncharacterized protein YqjF (DUF2071 family)
VTQTPRLPGIFLSADWRYLAMLNYAVDPALLARLVPPGTELDFFDGHAYVSLVAFRFLETRVRGFEIPFHRDFDEVNLRFYVRRRSNDGWRRGVTFVRELVPLPAIALVARLAFNENYIAVPMSHVVDDVRTGDDRNVRVEYRWRHRRVEGSIRVRATGTPVAAQEGSLEQFITEHYWGYARQRNGTSLEYEVRHEPWRVWPASEAALAGATAELYGPELARAVDREPDSAFLADGSPVNVLEGRPLL